MRRLPVYLVVDCSESMAGEAMDSVNEGLRSFLSSLRGDPYALETVWVSIITFASTARLVLPLTPISDVVFTPLGIAPGTALGSALQLLDSCIARDFVPTTPEIKGDWRALVFLMTDGQPTDAWQSAASRLTEVVGKRVASLYAIGCGNDVDFTILRTISDTVLALPELTPEDIKKMFVWMSASVSVGLDPDRMPDATFTLPEGLTDKVPERGIDQGAPRQVFMRARCSRSRQFYLMRFKLLEDGSTYEAVQSHPLEDSDESAAAALPPISSERLLGCPPCPHCGNPSAGMCECGTLFCLSPGPEGVVCPGCAATLTEGDSTSFEVTQSQG